MAKHEKAKDSPSKGAGSKRHRHSARTRENKARAAETRARRLEAAARRRESDVYQDPITGRKRRKGLLDRLDNRRKQAVKIKNKREDRRNFSKLTKAQQAKRRFPAPGWPNLTSSQD